MPLPTVFWWSKIWLLELWNGYNSNHKRLYCKCYSTSLVFLAMHFLMKATKGYFHLSHTFHVVIQFKSTTLNCKCLGKLDYHDIDVVRVAFTAFSQLHPSNMAAIYRNIQEVLLSPFLRFVTARSCYFYISNNRFSNGLTHLLLVTVPNVSNGNVTEA